MTQAAYLVAPAWTERLASSKLALNIIRILLLGGSLLLWEVASGRWIREVFVSKPSTVMRSFFAYLATGELLTHTWVTMSEALSGYFLGVAVGVAVGVLLGTSQHWGPTLEPFVVALYAIPRMALAPLFVVWFGLGLAPKVALVFLMSFFMSFFIVYGGAREIDADYLDLARIMGARPLSVFLLVTLPSLSPFIATALRICIPRAIVAAVVGEFVVARNGLGYFINRAALTVETEDLLAGVLALLIVTLVWHALTKLVEQRVLRWKSE